MTLAQRAIRDNDVMKVLKVEQLRHIVAHTNHGDLTLQLKKGQTEQDYIFVLDAVPCNAEQNKDLKILYKDILEL